jgi:excisionase family DNA binding protein
VEDIKIYDLEDLMKLFKVTRRTLYNYLKSGELKGKKIGAKWFVTEEDLKRFIDSR